MHEDRIRIVREDILSDNHYPLKNLTYEQRRQDGAWQTETREVYASASGATALLYNRARRSVLLTRQFRPGARLAGHHGFLIETPAGVLDEADPAERIRAEIREETGYAVERVHKVMTLFASPGTNTEQVHYFVAEYDDADRCGEGGGKQEEGEDIEVLEVGVDQALAWVDSGEIVDAKTVILLQYLRQRLLRPAGLTILVAGPYRSGTNDDPSLIERNVAAMEACVLPLYRAGHFPLLGEWLALPLLRLAGSTRPGDAVFDALFHPYAERLLERCDAVLRVGGPSEDADRIVALAQRLGKQVFQRLEEVPPASP
jgi:ADP-ribose pyrophosphatase